MQLFLKPTVVTDGTCNEIWFAIGVAYAMHQVMFDSNLTITAMRDGKHMQGSLHYSGRAVDIRTHDLQSGQADALCNVLKNSLGPRGFDVIRETEQEHIHIEYDPRNRAFSERLDDAGNIPKVNPAQSSKV